MITQRLIKAVVEGRFDAIADYNFEDLDTLFHELPWERLKRVHASRPDLLTFPEHQAVERIKVHGDQMDHNAWNELERTLVLIRTAGEQDSVAAFIVACRPAGHSLLHTATEVAQHLLEKVPFPLL